MKNILAMTHRRILEELSWSNVLLAFDFDGTLAPIVVDPNEARMRSTTRALLADACRRYPVVVLSGRARSDVVDKLEGIPVHAIIGNHGIETWGRPAQRESDARRWLPWLSSRLSALKGVTIEDKVYSISVHYRRSREKKKARRAILESAAGLPDVRVIGGKQVINLVPRDAPHKGIALLRERDRLRCDTALYVGDDETDEDVFALDEPGRLLTVRVGSKRDSGAAYCIPNQRAIDELLRLLVRARSEQRRSAP
jgi:trehalose 6-phosphate phosphatase